MCSSLEGLESGEKIMQHITKGQTNQIFLLLLFLVFGGLLFGFILSIKPAGEVGFTEANQHHEHSFSKAR
jgi:hypothetical protein